MTKESELKLAVKDYLKAMRVFNFPLIQGLASYRGAPDRIAIHKGKAYALEIKAPKGKMSEYQTEFKENWQGAGGIYLEIRDIDDLMVHF